VKAGGIAVGDGDSGTIEFCLWALRTAGFTEASYNRALPFFNPKKAFAPALRVKKKLFILAGDGESSNP